MNAQLITSPSGERMVLVSEADYKELLEAKETMEDLAAIAEFTRKLEAGEEELIPSEIVERLLSGENRIRVWREHRGLSSADLAEKAAIAPAYLSQIETGKRDGTIETMRKIAAALNLTLDDLVGV